MALTMIENNPALWLPVADHQATDIALFLLFWLVSGAGDSDRIGAWMGSMVDRLNFAIRTRSHYPTSQTDYRDITRTPADKSDEVFEERTLGSTLIPTLEAWIAAMEIRPLLTILAELSRDKLGHCTMQLWGPDNTSEAAFYLHTAEHGRALCDLPITETGHALVELVAADCETDTSWEGLSAVKTGFEPIILLACRHWRRPVPPEIYIASLKAAVDDQKRHLCTPMPSD